VHLDAGWVAHWLPRLAPDELAAYVALASAGPVRHYHDETQLSQALGGASDDAVSRLVDALVAHGLIEVVERRGRRHFHFRCRGADGVHRASAGAPSIQEALSEHRRMMEELLAVDAEDESDEVRERVFGRYPALRASYERRPGGGGDGRRAGWRLWLELALHLMGRFEDRYGELKREHAHVFKEASAQVLRLKLEMVDQITREVLANAEDIFGARGDGWIAGVPEEAFVALPLVRDLSRRYHVGAEQIYLNTVEALENQGLAIVELDGRGQVVDLTLPSTTGLDRKDERLAFFRLDELTDREIDQIDDTLRRMATARSRYREHLVKSAGRVLGDLAGRQRAGDLEALAALAAERVNDALELVRHEGDDPRCAVDPVAADEIAALLRERMGAAAAAEPTEA
jgi:DNA-binding transcriptional ArsR family regulator